MSWTRRGGGRAPRPPQLPLLLLRMTSLLLAVTSSCADYRVGVGIADMTGPVAEIGMMGYANPAQKTAGIHLRQFARAFVFDDGSSRLAFVSADCGMISHALKRQVLRRLRTEFGDTYADANLMLSATHTHSAPGGYLHYFLYDVSVLGFVRQTFDAYVDGIVQSVKRAHGSVVEAKVWLNSGELDGFSVNRSPAAYANNPSAERKRYPKDVDTTMVQLRLERLDGSPLGALQWFAVHPTSLNVTNHLISGDNVGAASLFLEQRMDPGALPGKGGFVGAFASSNLGDVSPNVVGPRCELSGQPCDEAVGCTGRGERCFSSGLGDDMFSSARLLALALVDKAAVKGCLPAMGYSFAAGTRDGPGPPGFKQGALTSDPLLDMVRNLLAKPTPADVRCHAAKPILVDTGRMSYPYPWQPRVVPTQLAALGQLAVACVPGELTTMSGRRLRAVLRPQLPSADLVVVAGLCNEYSSYVATPQEYQVQRYEGASTIFGPYTLPIYLQQYSKLAKALATNARLAEGPLPEDFSDKLVSFVAPVLFDNPPFRRQFGDVLRQPDNATRPGEVIHVVFVSGHPRNNPRHGDTFLTVEMRLADGTWKTVATDANWETRFRWERTNRALGYSEAHVTWEVPLDAAPGRYRVRHFGDYKYIFGGVYPYQGTSDTFQVVRDTGGSAAFL
ncbi:neutral ceramidase isoform X2 [Bacillus rossius redtenbacheri]|uniref:neutral ceramidase isoform X2 n=1 Tax=Bacillus rossius redtenbacheri TaxID=93214 RepID=UPI002FDEB369